MTLPRLISDDHILALEAEQDTKIKNIVRNYENSVQQAWEVKQAWLDAFKTTLSPAIACRMVDVSMSTYNRWRNTDPDFCRALNQIIGEAHEELVGAAYARATGYLREDADSPSGFQEDAAGRPIRFGQSDRLAIALLGAHRDDRRVGSVSVNINLAALGLDSEPAPSQGPVVATVDVDQVAEEGSNGP